MRYVFILRIQASKPHAVAGSNGRGWIIVAEIDLEEHTLAHAKRIGASECRQARGRGHRGVRYELMWNEPLFTPAGVAREVAR
jgi:hypothetical protein